MSTDSSQVGVALFPSCYYIFYHLLEMSGTKAFDLKKDVNVMLSAISEILLILRFSFRCYMLFDDNYALELRIFNNIIQLNQIVILGQISENCHGSQRVKNYWRALENVTLDL